MLIGGSFMGNTVTDQNVVPEGSSCSVPIVNATQEVNPNVTGAIDDYMGNPGSSILHETTEAYQGALISQQSGVSARPAKIEDQDDRNSVYMRSHLAATPQKVDNLHLAFYNAQGIEVQKPPGTNAIRAEATIQTGTKDRKIIYSYP
jgi:hypothetical protein